MKKIYPILLCGMIPYHASFAQSTTMEPMMAMESTLQANGDEFVHADIILNRFVAKDFSVAYNTQHSVTITWTAAPKTSTDRYTIMRSSNGKTFTAWRTVESEGEAGKLLSYLEVDEKPLSKTTYYRLMHTDKNGETAYSEIRAIKPNENAKESALEVFPYPGDDSVPTNANDVLVVLQDAKGETFYSRAYVTVEDGNATGISLHQALPAGTYVITASSNDGLIGNTFNIKQ